MLPKLFSLGPVTITSYGSLMVIAFLVGSFIVWKRGQEEHFDEEDLMDVTLFTVFWGIMGARAWFVAFHFNDIGLDPVKIFALTKFPGLSFFGGLFGGILALLWFSKRRKWEKMDIFDVMVLGLSGAQIFGWLGAFLNGSGYGRLTKLPWGLVFPGVEGSRHPVQIYAAILLFGAYLLLSKIFAEYRTYEWYKHKSTEAKPGVVFFSYLASLGLIGLVIYLLKPDIVYFLSLSLDWWISLGLFVFGSVFVYLRSGRVFSDDLKRIGRWIKKLLRNIISKIKKIKNKIIKRN